MDSIAIRNTVASDLPLLQAIQTAVDESFRAIGMADVADHKPPSLEELSASHESQHAWVATLSKERQDSAAPIAYILVYIVDNDGLGWRSVFIQQVSVSPDYSRRGIGKALIDHVALWASQNGMKALDLTAFVNVPWNKAYFERLGFRVADEEALLLDQYSGLRRNIICEWQKQFLGRWLRVAMRRPLTA
jgi:GNAT superfamily N-acetyltransferase